MSEAANLVTWNEVTDLGKIPGSEWVCPAGDLEAIGAIHNLSKRITEEDVHILADGRHQHLALMQFPEGYHAVKIIDTETGKVLTDEKYTKKYIGWATSRNATRCSPGVVGLLLGEPIDLDDGMQITAVEDLAGSIQTTLQPSKRPPYDHSLALSRIDISPQSRKLGMLVAGKVGAADMATFSVDEANAKVTGTLSLSGDVCGQMNLRLNGKGQVEKLTVSKSDALKPLSIHTSVDAKGKSSYESSYRQEISDPDQQSLILGVVVEAFGFDGPWKGLDMKATAAGLYAVMGQRNIDLSEHMRFQ